MLITIDEKRPCGNCGEEFWPRSLKLYRPLEIRVCRECYRALERREQAAREEALLTIRRL